MIEDAEISGLMRGVARGVKWFVAEQLAPLIKRADKLQQQQSAFEKRLAALEKKQP